jgi:hypothetical protein
MVLVAATIVCVVATSGLAVDRTILGTKLILNDKANRSRLVLVSKDDLLEVPAGAGAPDVVGATLTVRNPVTGRSGTAVLPAAFWQLNRRGTTFDYALFVRWNPSRERTPRSARPVGPRSWPALVGLPC